jgi:adenylate cyclase class 2
MISAIYPTIQGGAGMSKSDQELEVKFYLSNLTGLESRLKANQAALAQARVHETNLRFDTPDLQLTRSFRVLRLRQDNQSIVTYKGPGKETDGVRQRQELEFTVGDFDTAKVFFEALGYQVSVIYEKYRAVYDLGAVHITLDEMPFGNFAEIEGPDGKTIRETACRLGLDWEARIIDSYMVLFDRVKTALDLPFRDLTFENFQGLMVPASALGVSLAE